MVLNELELHPRVLFANYYIGMTRPAASILEHRSIYDYEIELVTEVSGGYMIQNNVPLTIHKGDILFRKPGEITQGINRYSSYIVCFQAQGEVRQLPTPYQLETPKTFQELIHHTLIDGLFESFSTNYYQRNLTNFKSIYNAYISPHNNSQLYMSALVIEILYHLNRELNAISNHRHPKADLIRHAMDYIQYHLQEDLSLEVLSSLYDYSAIYFHQLFKEVTGTTLSNYVTGKRLESAKETLVHSEDSIKSICYSVGFNDPSYFSSVFFKHTGFTPKNYRDTYRITYN